MITGTFDLFHAGHARILKEARTQMAHTNQLKSMLNGSQKSMGLRIEQLNCELVHTTQITKKIQGHNAN